MLLVILLVLLLGGGGWGYHTWGFYGGSIGLLPLVIIVLLLMGRL